MNPALIAKLAKRLSAPERQLYVGKSFIHGLQATAPQKKVSGKLGRMHR